MYREYTKTNKKPKINWNDYEYHEREPQYYKEYDASAELEDILVDHHPFLKHRVWRTMKKMRHDESRHERHVSPNRHSFS
jgi:hypothetical protein